MSATPLPKQPFKEERLAILALEDGSIFRGKSIGVSRGETHGEVVFNTSMTGYQEILTDPSYSRQIVTLTYPHIGNTGINLEDVEAKKIHAAGLIIKDLPLQVSNFRSTQTLSDYLKANGIVAIAGIDTRRLTRILREKGSLHGSILVGDDAQKALELSRSFPGLVGMDLAKVVSTSRLYEWTESEWQLDNGQGKTGYGSQAQPKYHVAVYDFGVKHNILRMLAERGCRLTVLPAQTPIEDVLALNPDGVFLSNGPGDPEPCDYAIRAAKTAMEKKIPIFGICLGHQIMAHASGAKTTKMPFGHHGANHPVEDIHTKQVLITSQNHGFAVDAATLPDNCRATHVSLFDGSLQGFERTDCPAFCFQGHPEASPGPHDVAYLFDHFIDLMETHTNA